MKVKNVMICWGIITLLAMTMIRAGIVSDRLLILSIAASAVIFSITYLSFVFSSRIKNLWNELKEMPALEALKALAFNPEEVTLSSAVEAANEIFLSISLDNDAQSLGIELSKLLRIIESNKIALSLAMKVKLFKFYQKYGELLGISEKYCFTGIGQCGYSKTGTTELMTRISEMELYILDLAKIMADPDIEQKLQAIEVSGFDEKLDFPSFRNNIEVAGFNYDFLAACVAKKKFIPSMDQINQECSR